MEKKFDLVSSMMKRLGITPSMLVLQCIEENILSFNCSVTDETSTIKFKSSNRDNKSQSNVKNNTEEETPETVDEYPDVVHPRVEKTFEEVFYKPINSNDVDKFEFNENTQEKVRCGMFVYANGSKFIISKNSVPLKLRQNGSLQFKGIMFASKEDEFLVVKFGEERCGYKRAVKKLTKGYKMMDSSDCEALFVYLDRICKAFEEIHINLRRIDKIFCLDTTDNSEKMPCIFSLKQGCLATNSDKSLSAGFMQVLTIKKLKK